jgi:hypothetical protein
MGLFHDTSDPLHGVTVVIETTGPELWVGRCNRVEPDRVLLFESDCYVDGRSSGSKEEWLKRVAMVGFHPRHPKLELARDQVTSVRPLLDYAT